MTSRPAALMRRGLSRSQAAEYVGVGTTKFDEMVDDGRMPKGFHVDRRVLWDIRDLDDAFEALKDAPQGNPWNEGAAA